jgi:hypothetical protein
MSSINGKVIKFNRKKGLVINPIIVEQSRIRNSLGVETSQTTKLVKNFGTILESSRFDHNHRIKFWVNVDKTLAEMLANCTINKTKVKKINDNFSKWIARPNLGKPKAKFAPQPIDNSDVDKILRKYGVNL